MHRWQEFGVFSKNDGGAESCTSNFGADKSVTGGEDGSQGAGKVLTAADANGNAYWATPSSLRPAITGSGTISETTSRGNGETQELVIRNLQAIINEQEAVFEAQSEKIKTLEGKLPLLLETP